MKTFADAKFNKKPQAGPRMIGEKAFIDNIRSPAKIERGFGA